MKKILPTIFLALMLWGCNRSDSAEETPQQTDINSAVPSAQMQGTYEISKFQLVYGEGSAAPYFDDNCTVKAIYTFDKSTDKICMKTQWECPDMQEFINECHEYGVLYDIASVFGTEEKFTILFNTEPGMSTRTVISGKRISKKVQKLDNKLFWKWKNAEQN